jgi:hypothetical protein
MNTFTEKDNCTFWGQYADIEQPPIKFRDLLINKGTNKNKQPIKKLIKILEPIKEEDTILINYHFDNKIFYYQLCILILCIYITIFMV